MKNKLLLFTSLICAPICLTSCVQKPEVINNQKEIIRTKFYLNYSATDLYVDSSLTLAPKVYKSKETLTWISSDSDIATVSSNGVVTAHKVGEAVITAYDSVSEGKCTINVIDYDNTFYVSLSVDSITLNVNDTYGVTAQLKTNDKTYPADFVVTLNNESVEGVASFEKVEDRFVFKALKSGTCIYSFVTSYNGNDYGANLEIKVN